MQNYIPTYLYKTGTCELGPIDQQELERLIDEQVITRESLVKRSDWNSWRMAAELDHMLLANPGGPSRRPGTKHWYFKLRGEEIGPLDHRELIHHAAAGRISPDTYVRRGLNGTLFPACDVKGLFARAKALNNNQSANKHPATQATATAATPSYLDRLADWHFKKYCVKGLLGIENNKRKALYVGVSNMLAINAFLAFSVVFVVSIFGYAAMNPVPPANDSRAKPNNMPDTVRDRIVKEFQYQGGFSKSDAEKAARAVWDFERNR